MSGFPILDVAIGLIFTYLVLSLVITALGELIASVIRRRPRTLHDGITSLLGSKQFAQKIYDHALIRSLHREGALTRLLKMKPWRPSYIPSGVFTLALIDTVAPNALTAAPAIPGSAPEEQLAALGSALIPRAESNHEIPPAVQTSLRILLADSNNSFSQFKAKVERWFDDGMERVSGWYTRRTQLIVFVLAALLTVAVNADTVSIIGTLWRDSSIRSTIVSQAQTYLEQAKQQPNTAGALPSVQVPTVAARSAAIPSSALQQGSVLANDTPEAMAPPPTPPFEQADVPESIDNLQKAIDRLGQLPLPLGWADCFNTLPCSSTTAVWPGTPFVGATHWKETVISHGLGWLMTILAISLGAPFWFDMLNKIITIRAAGKAPEEAPKQPKTVPQPRQPGAIP